jgi:hypothetical protein
MALAILLAVVGASAEHGTGAAQLRRGPASVVLSVLFTIAGLAGVGSLAQLFWGLVTRNRRSLDGSGPRRHSPILVAGAALVIFACLTALLALAARGRHIQSFRALGGKPLSRAGATTAPLPFNATASFTTSGIVVGVVVLAVTMKLVRSMGWRRVLRRLHPLTAGADTASVEADAQRSESEALGMQLALVTVADPGTEPDPRRAVIGCYLQMLEVAARHGPERRDSETPTEYLRRMLASTAATATPATSLTRLFERARYSQQPVGESMRFDAIAAIEALRNDLLAGTRLQAMPARRASLLSSDRSASEPRRPATSMRRFDPGSSLLTKSCLASRGVALSDRERAVGMLGIDAYALVDPDGAPPADRFEPGVPLDRVRRLLDRLETLRSSP